MIRIFALLASLLPAACGFNPAFAFDEGQWDGQDKAIREWFRGLMQPDNPSISCCGEADAYWADSFQTTEDGLIAIITDERPDAPLGRPHIEPGTKIAVPKHKIKHDGGNPTGHFVIFVSRGGDVYCFVTGTLS